MKNIGSSISIAVGILTLAAGLNAFQKSPSGALSFVDLSTYLILGGLAFRSSKHRRRNIKSARSIRILIELSLISVITFILFGGGKEFFFKRLYEEPLPTMVGLCSLLFWIASCLLPKQLQQSERPQTDGVGSREVETHLSGGTAAQEYTDASLSRGGTSLGERSLASSELEGSVKPSFSDASETPSRSLEIIDNYPDAKIILSYHKDALEEFKKLKNFPEDVQEMFLEILVAERAIDPAALLARCVKQCLKKENGEWGDEFDSFLPRLLPLNLSDLTELFRVFPVLSRISSPDVVLNQVILREQGAPLRTVLVEDKDGEKCTFEYFRNGRILLETPKLAFSCLEDLYDYLQTPEGQRAPFWALQGIEGALIRELYDPNGRLRR